MRILTTLAIILFYLQHAILMIIVTLANFIKYALKWITKTNS